MIEADVSMGTIAGGDGNIMPIMAHPPVNTSDLSLEEFLDTILSSGITAPKGIKLDFKDLEALEPSLMAIKSRASKVVVKHVYADIESNSALEIHNKFFFTRLMLLFG